MAAPKTLLALYGVRSRILLNGAESIVVGRGTRSSARKRPLSLPAGMDQMDTPLVEGHATAAPRPPRRIAFRA